MGPHAQFLLRHAIPGAAVGVAGAAAFGMIGAKGDPEGAAAGVGAIFGGGPSGMWSGGVLGTMAGVGSVALAARHKGFRTKLVSGLTDLFRSNPLQQLAKQATQLGSNVPGAALRAGAMQRIADFGRMPHAQAMQALHDYLVGKQARRYAMGALMGGAAGAAIGGPMGMARRAFAAGEQL